MALTIHTPLGEAIAALPAGLELRRVRISSHMSRGTTCFSGEVWIDGARVGTVENDGQGGANRYDPYTTTVRALQAIAGAMGYTGLEPEDYLIGLLVARHEATKRLKQMLGNSVVFVGTDGKLRRQPPPRGTGHPGPEHMAHLVKTVAAKPNVQTILNGRPLAEAVALYFQHA